MTMSRDEFLSAVHRPGAFQRVEWESDTTRRDLCATARNAGVRARKITTATIRTGIDYANTRAVVDASREVGPLPWGEWAVEGYVITHKGKDYVRLYVSPDTIRTRYMLTDPNGHESEVSRDRYLADCIPSVATREAPTSGTITVRLDSIRALS